MLRKTASIPLALVTAVTIGCQSHPTPGSLADIKREQERKLFSECIAEHRVLYRGNSNTDYSSLRVGLVKVCREDADARVW
jgi:hypothetical protein